jgi:hypothetical protein
LELSQEMLTNFYNKLKRILQFFIEKPSAQGDWQWVHEEGVSSEIQTDKIYIPQQLKYFMNDQSLVDSTVESNSWNTQKLINLSNTLAKAYTPGSQETPTSDTNERN